MEELNFIELHRKISAIVFNWHKDQATARTYPMTLPDVMLINLLGPYIHSQRFWEDYSVAIITHETLHNVIFRLEGVEASKKMDLLWPTTNRSLFLVDGNWEWFV